MKTVEEHDATHIYLPLMVFNDATGKMIKAEYSLEVAEQFKEKYGIDLVDVLTDVVKNLKSVSSQ